MIRTERAQLTFEARLLERIEKTGSHLSVGLDPRPDLIDGDVHDFLRRVIDGVQDLAAVFKPNVAFFEAMGTVGYKMLDDLLREIPEDVPVILDAKRSDIPETQACYAQAYFEKWNVSAMTLNPYLGFDSCEPFLKYAGKGVYLLAVTSNAGASQIQLKKYPDGWGFEEVLKMALQAKSYGMPATIGLVVGLTNLSDEMLERIPDLPLLIPGLGAQGGDLTRLFRQNMRKAPVVVNVSRSLLYGPGTNGFRSRAIAFKEKINDVFGG